MPRTDGSSGFDDARADYIGAHLRALACAGRKFAGQSVGFVDEVDAYFDVQISQGRSGPLPRRARPARRRARRHRSAGRADAGLPQRRGDPAGAPRGVHPRVLQRAARQGARRVTRCPTAETIDYEVVTDKPWSGFNYYLGDYRSTVAVNADLKPADVQPAAAGRPRVLSRATTPSTAARRPGWWPGRATPSRRIFLVNTPQCLMAEGLADLALYAAIGPELGQLGRRDLRRPGPALRRRARRGGVGGDGGAGRRPPGRRADAARRAPRRRRRGRRSCSAGCWSTTSGPGRRCGSCPRRCGGPTPAPTSRATGCCGPGWTTGPPGSASPSGSAGCSTSR